MEQKINIAELLKDCPSGMELDCTMFGGLEFDDIVDNEYLPIRCRIKNPNGGYNVFNFTKYGCWLNTTFAKCVIFPKGKTTWEGFHRPFVNGDIVAGENCACSYITIFRKFIDNISFSHHACLTSFGKFNVDDISDNANLRFATEEEKQKLFDAIKERGYHWNAETKTLEKLVEPKFNVGDRIKHKEKTRWVCTIARIEDRYYADGHPMCYTIPFGKQDEYELVPNKFDINTLVPFESKVLVRDINSGYWIGAFYSHYNSKKFYTIGGSRYYQCIPYEGNEHLLSTREDCNEYYKVW